ncbi:MAG: 4-hydroxyphenylpyruvate dioxygenase [Bryobacteraceae bacterium]|nr:4-hydroxyphenylpyruvate dioxygenase [Bryobacteraceae bacterium]MDW8379864.1 4-hydroxyphenylpyruvate dioxygenase [Bryobacterales bacterium]
MSPVPETQAGTPTRDFLPLLGVDHVEYYVGNAKQAAHYYRTAFGFRWIAYQGPETGVSDRVSYVLEQGKIRLLLSAALRPNSPLAEHVLRHGDGVRSIALQVEDAESAYSEVVQRGAQITQPLVEERDDQGLVRWFSIAIYGDTLHTFVERRNYQGIFLPGYHAAPGPDELARPVGLRQIDHIVGNVGWGEMNRWVSFYERVLGFQLYQSFDDQDISTEYSALMSKVMSDGGGKLKFPINEPAHGKRRSQVEEYLDFYQGPGVQHIALATDDILGTVSRLKEHGVEFLDVPPTYYEMLPSRLGEIPEPLEQIAQLGILVDRDAEGYLLQIFTKPVEDRPTLFYEIIERRGSRGFGKGNFKALFEAIEREQARRGNL